MILRRDTMKNILITPEGIKTNLKNVKPLEAICEYIWNGFDAGASQIKVYLHTNELGLINMVSVIDNGTGIVYHELPYKFQPFNESKKAGQSSRSNHSLPHGRKGIGRLTFFSFAQMARWDTVYEKGGKKYQYYIDMNKDSLNEYDDNGGKEPVETSASVGTKVTFTQLITLSKDEIIDEIKNEFFWFIELNKSNQYEIWVDDELISYEDIVMNRIELDMKQFKLEHEYDVTFVQWNRSLGQGDDSKVIIDHEDKNKEMDIYMIRQDRRGNVTENVVVELKRPTVPLGEEQLSQVKKYMRVIKSDDRFNASNVKWTYFLVGNRLNKNGYIQDEIEGHKTLGEPHLVHADSNGNNKIYVLTWSDIFDEFSLRHEYLMRKLELEKEIWLKKHDSIENVVEDIKDNSATLDSALIPKHAQH